MLELFNKLHEILIAQIVHYKELFILLHEEKELIKNSATDDLHKNSRKKESVILLINTLEEDCKNILEQLNDKAPVDMRPVTLSKIIRTIKMPRLKDLKNTYLELISLVREIKEINEDNRMYLNGSLRAVQGSISFLISCAKAGTPFYAQDGHLKSESLTSAMISEEV